MRSRPHLVIVILLLVVAGVALYVSFTRVGGKAFSSPEPVRARGGLPVPAHDEQFGVVWSQAENGVTIMAFRPPPMPSPLQLLGVAAGDTIVAINGVPARMRTISATLEGAIDECREQGTRLEIRIRRGESERLLEFDNMPAMESPRLPLAEEKPE